MKSLNLLTCFSLVFCLGIFCVLGGIYYLLQDNIGFDNLVHGKSPKKNQKQRSLEDFGTSSSPLQILRVTIMLILRSRIVTTCLHPT